MRPLSSLAVAVEAIQPQLVIPCDEFGVRHLHDLFSRSRDKRGLAVNFAALIERSLGSPKSYAVVTSRHDLLNAAYEEGIRVPNMRRVRTIHDLRSWGRDNPFPCVLKADGTFGGLGVRIAHTQEQAEQFFSELDRPHQTIRVLKRLLIYRDPFWIRPWWKRQRPEIIIQSFIPGRPANCAVVCWGGKVLAGLSVEVVASMADVGPATVVRVVDNPEMMLAAERIARRLGLSGFFGLDFIIEEETRAACLIEMNPRCTPLCHLQLGKGRDMISALTAELTGQPLREVPPVTDNDLIAYFPQAWSFSKELLPLSFQDIPQDPELIHALLQPWPERTFFFRLTQAHTKSATLLKFFAR
jgi:hypothetical protein